MPLLTENSLVIYVLRRRYWVSVITLTCAIWVLVAFLIYPLKNSDGTYTSYPLGLTTELENRALDLLFQLRDARRPGMRSRGQSESISIIEIDEASIKASRVRLQKWPRNWYAQMVDRASEGGATVIGLDIFLSEEGGTSSEDREADRQLVDADGVLSEPVTNCWRGRNGLAVGQAASTAPTRRQADGNRHS